MKRQVLHGFKILLKDTCWQIPVLIVSLYRVKPDQIRHKTVIKQHPRGNIFLYLVIVIHHSVSGMLLLTILDQKKKK